MKPVILRGRRAVLRPWKTADAEEVLPHLRGAAGRRLTRFMAWEASGRLADRLRFVQAAKAGWKKGDSLTWLVEHEGRLAGSTGLHKIDRMNRSAEIGIWIAPSLHRRGLGQETCSLVIQFGFDTLGLERIVYPYFAGNHPSAALAKSLGAVREGRLRRARWKRGKFLDEIVSSILRKEWVKRRALERRNEGVEKIIRRNKIRERKV